jgi:hypothetical protein
MDINFKEDLIKFNSDHAKLFYMIYFFHRNKKINCNQKQKLKSLIISDNDELFNLLDQFEETLNEKKLLKELLIILKENSETDQAMQINKDDSSHSEIQKRNLSKNSYESTLKISGSKGHSDRSFLNKTTIPYDSSVKNKFARLNDFRVEVIF